jgi:hypothetical protein
MPAATAPVRTPGSLTSRFCPDRRNITVSKVLSSYVADTEFFFNQLSDDRRKDLPSTRSHVAPPPSGHRPAHRWEGASGTTH